MIEVSLTHQIIERLKTHSSGERIGYLSSDVLSERKNVEYYDKLFDIKALCVGEHKVLKIDTYGFEILKKKLTVLLAVDKLGSLQKEEESSVELSENEKVNEEFKQLRRQIALEQNVPAYIVFGDKTLLQMAQKLPQTNEEMLDISGVGEQKLEKYGDIFLELCKKLKPSQKFSPKKDSFH